MVRNSPKWATPNRQAHLVDLFVRSRGFCVFGHRNCLIPEHHYENFIEGLISDWIAEDRAYSASLWQAERRELHRLNERRLPLRGQFNAIGKDIFYAFQPQFYHAGLSISGLTLKPFAKVRIASTYLYLYVDLGDSLKPTSKNVRRKAMRYGRPLPDDIQAKVNRRCYEAVRHYLAH